MVNYSESKIFKIVSKNCETDLCYVGCTTKKYLSQRLSALKASYLVWKRTNKNFDEVYSFFDEYGVENCKIELLEFFPCDSKIELDRKTNEYIKVLNCVNKNTKVIVQVQPELEYECFVEIVDELPSDDYLINLRNEYLKYENQYPRIDKLLRWNENNKNVNLDYHYRVWCNLMSYINVDIRDVYAKPIDS